jgi:VacB/RNase II family 3'-5' exoribonuclease
MLDLNALSQLKELKQNLDDAKERASATVKGTQRKFGFAVLEDGREVFLSPDEMNKVFPGDQIEIAVETSSDGKSSGQIEKLVSSSLNTFTGRYLIKGQGHFVEPDLPQLTRWIFIPPAGRLEAKAGDLICCSITRHPFANGKPQASIEKVIGPASQAGIEANYIIEKFALPQQWPKDWQAELIEPDLKTREDLSALDFVTIDAAETKDMDDALHIESTDKGWQLSVAIADPTAFIPIDSNLEQAAKLRSCTVYLPGNAQAMLPTELANERCSLVANEQRPALVCRMDINHSGDIEHYQLTEACIKVSAKLNYQQVTETLSTESEQHPHFIMLQKLQACSKALLSQRQRDHLLMDDKPDYHLQLNEQGKIEAIHRQDKTLAHSIVEECMVAANRCATNFLGSDGLFVQHAGFREEKMEFAANLAEQQLEMSAKPSELNGYIALIRQAEKASGEHPIKTVFTRWLQRSNLSQTPQPHFGMGLPAYTTFTSPIRKYSDFLVHRLIKAKLTGQPKPEINDTQLEQLQNQIHTGRRARNEMEQWLQCQYLKDMQGQDTQGTVVQVNSHGFTVRLNDTGIDGFVESRGLEGKYSFDPLLLTLTNKQQHRIQLNQAVQVKIAQVDVEQRNIRYQLVI